MRVTKETIEIEGTDGTNVTLGTTEFFDKDGIRIVCNPKIIASLLGIYKYMMKKELGKRYKNPTLEQVIKIMADGGDRYERAKENEHLSQAVKTMLQVDPSAWISRLLAPLSVSQLKAIQTFIGLELKYRNRTSYK